MGGGRTSSRVHPRVIQLLKQFYHLKNQLQHHQNVLLQTRR